MEGNPWFKKLMEFN